MTIALRFTEWMDGFAALGESDCETGYRVGQESGLPLSMQLTLSTADLDAFIKSPDRLLLADGELSHPLLGDKLPARGSVNQLIDVGDDSRHKTMPYRLEFSDGAGRPRKVSALKRVDPPLRDAWKDTTTLDVLILDSSDRVIGAGIVYIRFRLFLRQFITYHCSGGTRLGRMLAPPRFYASFMAKLWEVYGFRLRGGR
jgi:cholesterol oxidase